MSRIGRLTGRAAGRLATSMLAIAAAVMLWTDDSHAFGSGDDRGSAGFRGLLMAPDARSAALGGASVALPGSTGQLTSNPAAMAGVRSRAVSLSATSYVLDIMPVGGVLAFRTSSGVWSVSVHDISYGDFDRVDQFAASGGTFDAGDIAARVGWARRVSYGIAIGANVGWIRSTIADNSASAAVFGIGAQWQPGDGNSVVGVSATNVGTALSSFVGGDQGMKDEVPTALHVGAMHRPQHFPLPLTLFTEVKLPRDDDASLSTGAELRPFGPLVVRVGYVSLIRYVSTSVEGESGGIALDDRRTSGFGGLGLRAGVGAVWNSYGADYAYGPAGPFGGVHHVSLRVLW